MSLLDYSLPADLYPARNRSRKSPLRYMRFDTVAEALRFAVEQLPPEQLVGTMLEVDEDRFDAIGIGQLYRSDDYPLVRAVAAA